MKRKTHLFLLAVDEDPIPGAFDKDRIFEDVKGIVERSIISAYHPRVIGLGKVERDSNFNKDTSVDLSMTLANVVKTEDGDIDVDATEVILSTPIWIFYPAYNNELPGDEDV